GPIESNREDQPLQLSNRNLQHRFGARCTLEQPLARRCRGFILGAKAQNAADQGLKRIPRVGGHQGDNRRVPRRRLTTQGLDEIADGFRRHLESSARGRLSIGDCGALHSISFSTAPSSAETGRKARRQLRLRGKLLCSVPGLARTLTKQFSFDGPRCCGLVVVGGGTAHPQEATAMDVGKDKLLEMY